TGRPSTESSATSDDLPFCSVLNASIQIDPEQVAGRASRPDPRNQTSFTIGDLGYAVSARGTHPPIEPTPHIMAAAAPLEAVSIDTEPAGRMKECFWPAGPRRASQSS